MRSFISYMFVLFVFINIVIGYLLVPITAFLGLFFSPDKDPFIKYYRWLGSKILRF